MVIELLLILYFFYEIDRGEKYIVKKIRFNLHYSFYRY